MANGKIDPEKSAELNEEAKKCAADARGKSPILVIGATGAGKSTTINLVYGCPMQVEDEGFSKKLTVVGKGIVKIGDSVDSETLYPQVVPVDEINLVDLPGFGENREIEKKICAANGVLEVIKQADSIRGVMVVIDLDSLKAVRSEGFKKVVYTFSELLNSPGAMSEKEKQAICFVITKVPPDLTKNNIITGITNLKAKYEESLKRSSADKVENQRQLDVLNLINGNNLLIVRNDGTGYSVDDSNLLDITQNRHSIIQYLTKIPENSLSKNSFQLTKPTSKIAEEVRFQNAYNKLFALSKVSDSEFITQLLKNKPNAAEKVMQDIHVLLAALEELMRSTAAGYFGVIDGQQFDSLAANQKLQDIHTKINLLFQTKPYVSAEIVEHIIKSLKYLRELNAAIDSRFKNDLISDTLLDLIDSLTLIQTQLHHQVHLISHENMLTDKNNMQAAVLHAHHAFTDSTTRLAGLEQDKLNNINTNNQTRTNLEDNLTARRTAITNLGARPALAPVPGNPSPVHPHPGVEPPAPGPEPHVPPHPGNPPHGGFGFLNPAGYAIAWGIWKGKLNAFHEAEHAHGEWARRRDSYNTYHANLHQHNVTNGAYQAWQTRNNNYTNSVTAQANYDSNRAAAVSARDRAQLDLDTHNLNARNELAALNAQITAEKATVAAAKLLRLLVIGANESLSTLISSADRITAIEMYKIMVDRLKIFLPNLPANTIDHLEQTLESLRQENTKISTLYISAEMADSEIQHIIFERNKPFDEQLNKLTEEVQVISLNHARNLAEISQLCQSLRGCASLRSLDMQNSELDKTQFAKLLPILMHLPSLLSLNLANCKLDNASAMALIALIYSHPTLIDLNLDCTMISPVIVQLIKGLLALKLNVKENEKIAAFDRYVESYFHSNELLSLEDNENENREFNITVSDDNDISASYVDKSGKLKFAGYITELKACRDKLKLNSINYSNVNPTVAVPAMQTAKTQVSNGNNAGYQPKSRNTSAFFKIMSEDAKPFFSRKLSNSWEQATHWYTHDEMSRLLDNIFGNNDDVDVFTAIDGTQFQGATLVDNLNDRLMQHIANESLGLKKPKHLVLPVNINGNHWVALDINLSNDANPLVAYVDPFGKAMPKNIEDAIKSVFPGISNANLIVSPIRLQNDGYNCGPWVIESLRYIIAKGALPDNLNIEQARRAHQMIIRDQLAAEASAPKAKYP